MHVDKEQGEESKRLAKEYLFSCVCMRVYVCVCVYVCMCVYIHTHKYVRTCIVLCVKTLISTFTHIHVCSYMYSNVSTNKKKQIFRTIIDIHTRIHIRTYIHTYIYMFSLQVLAPKKFAPKRSRHFWSSNRVPLNWGETG